MVGGMEMEARHALVAISLFAVNPSFVFQPAGVYVTNVTASLPPGRCIWLHWRRTKRRSIVRCGVPDGLGIARLLHLGCRRPVIGVGLTYNRTAGISRRTIGD
jgi:hypothetical protein